MTEDWKARAERAEAQLAQCREALEDAEEALAQLMVDEAECPQLLAESVKTNVLEANVLEKVRAAIAATEGKPETEPENCPKYRCDYVWEEK